MRTAGCSFRFAIFALLAPTVCFSQSQSPSPQGVFLSATGTVLLSGDDRPVRHARVELFLEDSGSAISTLTDDKGQFHFAQLSPATYRITVTAPACETYQLTTSLPATNPVVVRLHKLASPPTPRNDSVVSVQELVTPNKAVHAFEKGSDLLLKGEADASLPYFYAVVEKSPAYYRAYHNLGLALYLLGQLDAAEQNFQKSIDLTNGGFAPSLFGLSMVLYRRSDYRHAESLIQRGLLMAPASAVGNYCLGLVQFSLGHISDSERSAMNALKLDPDEADAHLLLAHIHERQHNPFAMLTDAQAYLKIDPNGALHAEALDLLHRAQQDYSRTAATQN
jgi:tetratricopeptide (TPR) repeat protein